MLYDLATQVSIAAAVLYFWGEANLAGEAAALDLTIGLLQKDLWSTISHGLQGAVLASFLLPLTEASFEGTGPLLAKMSAGAIAGTALMMWIAWQSNYRRLLMCLWATVVFALWITVHSMMLVSAQIVAFNTCISTGVCALHHAAAEVSFELERDQLATRRGVIHSTGTTNLVLLTPGGVVAIPTSSIRLITTSSIENILPEGRSTTFVPGNTQ